MTKMTPAIIIVSLSCGANALVLNKERIHFQTQIKNIKTHRDLNQESVRLIKFKKPLSQKDKVKYFDEGVESIEYAGDLSYYFYGKKGVLDKILFKETKFSPSKHSSNFLIGYASVLPSAKISKELLYGKNLPQELLLNVSFFKVIEPSLLKDKFPGIDFEILKVYPNGKKIVLKINKDDLKKLASNPLVKYIERKVNKLKLIDGIEKDISKKRNIVSAEMMHVKELWDAPYNLKGEGIKIGVVDGGRIRDTHREFMVNGISRIKILDSNAPLSSHATHVAGTIGALGLNPLAHGMANESEIYSYYFQDAYFAEAAYKLYTNEDIKLSNHSYGYAEAIRLGEYDTEAASQDENIYNHPEILQFVAAGNDRGSEGYPEYGITKGPVNSKNIFTIGALRKDKKIAYFSSTGPTSDGRIKPDLVSDGWSLYSCDSKNDKAYINMSGTSMATPGATGAAALIAEAYKRVTGKDITADILKAVLFNTAQDLGREGPDYEYGYGLINAKKAVDLIKSLNSSSPLIYTDSIANSQEKTLTFYSNGEKEIKITISWIDPAGNVANKSKNLVNDIDIKVTRGDKTYYPFTLDKNNPELPAVANKENHTDNSEQIVIKNPLKGEYTLVIRGSLIITDKQKFAIASNTPLFLKDYSIIDTDVSKVVWDDVKRGKKSDIEEITLKNSGAEDLTVFNISASSGDFGLDFGLQNHCPNSFPFVLEKKKSCSLGVYVLSNKKGDIQGYLDIVNDSFNAPEKRVSLKAHIVDALAVLNLYHTLHFDFNDESDILDKNSGWMIKEGFLRSKDIDNAQETDYNMKVSVYDDSQLSFRYNISSELDYDLFKFYINGQEIFSDSGIKRNVIFSQYLSKGDYNFKWSYQKDYEISLGDDAVYIDDIQITKAVFNSYTFPKTEISQKSRPDILYLKNAGLVPLKVNDVYLKYGKNFALDMFEGEKPCKNVNFSLNPGSYCTFGIFFTPKEEGASSDYLIIDSSDKKAKKEYLLKGEGKSTYKEDKYVSFAKFIYNVLHSISSSSQIDIKTLADKLKNKESAFKIVKNTIFSPQYINSLSDENYLRMLLKMVKKDDDVSLYNYYLERLKSGAISRKLLADEIFLKNDWISLCNENSVKPFDKDDQIEAFIERFYNYSLKRDSDEGGMSYWLDALKTKRKNAIEIGIYFFLSPEFLAKKLKDKEVVSMLYRTFLNREPDNGGLNYWVDRIKHGLSRKDLIAGFAYSKEFSQIASSYGVQAH